ncbi:3D domain-containing protein [Prosthecochloris sp. ZM_2]|uniref:3D domain-containing protein n=1 Tax=Prosthecochloris sp. ZM_2 TaxID=2045206 RepID=UPI0018F62DB3|nr:3D domain-containing protein [Prosthecochloris sp. ZM_2]
MLPGSFVSTTLTVTATAYTSSPQETDSTPSVTAWGDTLKPGVKAIAVSRDLIDMGLTHQQDVKIQGFDGSFRVLDKMNRRWEKRIDIYMDNNRKKARNWGKQEVTIFW